MESTETALGVSADAAAARFTPNDSMESTETGYSKRVVLLIYGQFHPQRLDGEY